MIRTRLTRPSRHAVRTAALLLATAVAACSSGSGDAARTDSAAVASSASPSATVQPGNPSGTMSSDSATGAAGTAATGTVAGSAAAAGGAGTGASGTGASPAAGAMLDPSAATREQLVAVPGMTAAAADALIAGRPYQTMTAVDQALAKHLGAAERKTVYARLWKPIDLNTAAGPEILLIPGVGARMRHEFEEYRPYKSIEQFRREIGKYVDKDEVARLERYVTIR